jgi:hypothetical protein
MVVERSVRTKQHEMDMHGKKTSQAMSKGLSWCLLWAIMLHVLISSVEAEMKDESWAEKWCELNDCYGVKERAKAQTAIEKMESEVRKVARR